MEPIASNAPGRLPSSTHVAAVFGGLLQPQSLRRGIVGPGLANPIRDLRSLPRLRQTLRIRLVADASSEVAPSRQLSALSLQLRIDWLYPLHHGYDPSDRRQSSTVGAAQFSPAFQCWVKVLCRSRVALATSQVFAETPQQFHATATSDLVLTSAANPSASGGCSFQLCASSVALQGRQSAFLT